MVDYVVDNHGIKFILMTTLYSFFYPFFLALSLHFFFFKISFFFNSWSRGLLSLFQVLFRLFLGYFSFFFLLFYPVKYTIQGAKTIVWVKHATIRSTQYYVGEGPRSQEPHAPKDNLWALLVWLLGPPTTTGI